MKDAQSSEFAAPVSSSHILWVCALYPRNLAVLDHSFLEEKGYGKVALDSAKA